MKIFEIIKPKNQKKYIQYDSQEWITMVHIQKNI